MFSCCLNSLLCLPTIAYHILYPTRCPFFSCSSPCHHCDIVYTNSVVLNTVLQGTIKSRYIKQLNSINKGGQNYKCHLCTTERNVCEKVVCSHNIYVRYKYLFFKTPIHWRLYSQINSIEWTSKNVIPFLKYQFSVFTVLYIIIICL